MTEVNYTAVLAEAFHKPVAAERAIGCCRVYVSVTTPDKFKLAGVKKAVKKLGKIFQPKSHYGDRNAIYVGYDNCTGVELARATVVVETLKAAGVECYRCENGD